MIRRKLPQSRLGSRRKVGVYFTPDEQVQLESLAKQRATSASAIIYGFVRDGIEREASATAPDPDQLENLLLTLMSRLTKLERIQRTLVLNTAYARGYAMGSARTSPSESRKTIEQEMAKFYEKQREFFFELYPEQRDGETKEARS